MLLFDLVSWLIICYTEKLEQEVTALKSQCLGSPFTLNREQREQLSSNFRGQVIMEALGNLSLQSLQALLIITILDYGAGKLSEFWNLVATCKR